MAWQLFRKCCIIKTVLVCTCKAWKSQKEDPRWCLIGGQGRQFYTSKSVYCFAECYFTRGDESYIKLFCGSVGSCANWEKLLKVMSPEVMSAGVWRRHVWRWKKNSKSIYQTSVACSSSLCEAAVEITGLETAENFGQKKVCEWFKIH